MTTPVGWVTEAEQWKARAWELAKQMEYAQLEAWARALNGEDVPARVVLDMPREES